MSIHMQNIVFYYRKNEPVLSLEGLSINEGEQIFIHGPSGSGKTTLLGLLAGVLIPVSGSVRVLDTELSSLSPAGRDAFRGNHIGYIFQQFNLVPYLNVEDNIALSCLLAPERKKRLTGSLSESVREIASRLHIDDILRRPVHALSTGQGQRVAAARALLGSPEIIIADEPTSSLDADRREAFLELLFENCERTRATLIFVSHDMALSKSFHRTISLSEINGSHGDGSEV